MPMHPLRTAAVEGLAPEVENGWRIARRKEVAAWTLAVSRFWVRMRVYGWKVRRVKKTAFPSKAVASYGVRRDLSTA